MTFTRARKITPFKNAEEIAASIRANGGPKSLWQQGCDDGRAGIPRRRPVQGGIYSGYTQGYDEALKATGNFDPSIPDKPRHTIPGYYYNEDPTLDDESQDHGGYWEHVRQK